MQSLNNSPRRLLRIQINSHTHAAQTKSLLHHLLTHIHNVFLSPAAHQGLGKLPGMKEIWSLMGLFHAYGGKRHSWNFFFFGSQEKVKPNEALPDWSFLFSLWIRMDLGVFCLFVWGDFLFVGFRIKLEVLWILGIFWLWSSPLKVELYIFFGRC